MERADAFRTLRLDPSADGQMVENAYWNLARKAQQRGAEDVLAREEMVRLNEAYNTLAPGNGPQAGAGAYEARAPGGSGLEFLDSIVEWLSREAMRTRQRWPGRNLEIALISGGALVLMVLAIGAGASLIAILIAVVVICAGIWAPWRKPE